MDHRINVGRISYHIDICRWCHEYFGPIGGRWDWWLDANMNREYCFDNGIDFTLFVLRWSDVVNDEKIPDRRE